MYEKVCFELFSSIIGKINQIPSITKPFKEAPYRLAPKKLCSLYNMYELRTTEEVIFDQIFTNISDIELKNNLMEIMLHIGTKYKYNSTTSDNSIFFKKANDKLMALFATTWNYFSNQCENLKSIDFENSTYDSKEIKEYEICFKEIVSFMCGLINLTIFVLRKQFHVIDYYYKYQTKNIDGVFNKTHVIMEKEYIQTEINILYIVHKNRVWLDPIITLLEQLLKFFWSSNCFMFMNIKLEKYRKREKEGQITKEEVIQKVKEYAFFIIDDYNAFRVLFTIVAKYSSLNNPNIIINSIVNINDLSELMQRLWNIYFIFIMNEEYINITTTEEELFSVGIRIIETLLNSKYKDPNYGIDFRSYFYATESFIKEIFEDIIWRMLLGINEINAFIKVGGMKNDFPNLNLLQKLEITLKDYILFTMITGYNKDSLCDCHMNYEKHRLVYMCFGFVKAYLIICKIIKKSMFFENIFRFGTNNENIIKKREIIIGNIFDALLNEVQKYKIVLPIKMFLYKNYITQSFLVVLYKFVKAFSNDILNINTDKAIFYKNISIIQEMADSVNIFYFLFGNDILNCLNFPKEIRKNDINNSNQNQSTVPFIRIIDPANPINYYDIIQERVSNTIKISAQSKKVKIISPMGSSILYSLKKKGIKDKKMNHQTTLEDFYKKYNNKKINLKEDSSDDSMENMDINDNEYNMFKSNLMKSEVRKRGSNILNNLTYRYDITEFVEFFKLDFFGPTKKIGYEVKKEKDKYYLYILSELDINPNVNHLLYVKYEEVKDISLYKTNLFNLIRGEPLSNQAIDQLYVSLLDGVEEDLNKRKNIENSMKYYDVNFKMDYFTFVEKCKELLL